MVLMLVVQEAAKANPKLELWYFQWVRIFCDGRNWLDYANLIALDLSGPIASG